MYSYQRKFQANKRDFLSSYNYPQLKFLQDRKNAINRTTSDGNLKFVYSNEVNKAVSSMYISRYYDPEDSLVVLRLAKLKPKAELYRLPDIYADVVRRPTFQNAWEPMINERLADARRRSKTAKMTRSFDNVSIVSRSSSSRKSISSILKQRPATTSVKPPSSARTCHTSSSAREPVFISQKAKVRFLE
ncbi:unnamed protein product [Dimorphilus gyrociliatus]|uniref:Uncharacterized protein n=1 Tax=Dimorphilus gyrociliatus TaxID=2664684 RepID=A0A7I8WCI5_9ANNE|nr:unnamed protein product [Dimorphilus gyrociliatus]